MQKTIRKLGLATCLALGFALTAAHGASLSVPGNSASPLDRSTASASQFGQLPLMFESAHSTGASHPAYVAHGTGYSLLIESTGAKLQLTQTIPGDPQFVGKRARLASRIGRMVELDFVAGAAESSISAEQMLSSKVNYLIGNDPSQWKTGLATYAKVRTRNVYPGIDVVYYGNQRQLEYDIVVAPGVNPSQIGLSFSGSNKIEITPGGDAAIYLGTSSIIQRKPVAYQMIAGKRIEVQASYILENSTLRLQIGRYDSRSELIIDPLLNYTTYLGGLGQDIGWAIAVDGSGNAYIAGETESSNFPVTNGINQTVSLNGVLTNYNGTNFSGSVNIGGDAFVAELNPSGTAFTFVTYLGGSGHDIAFSLKLDSTGVCLGGITSSPNFPIFHGSQTNIGGTKGEFLNAYPFDGFIAKLNLTGTQLLYSTYFGGSGQDEIFGIEISKAAGYAGYVYATGLTTSPEFTNSTYSSSYQSVPYQPALNNASGSSTPDAFIVCFDPSGSGPSSLKYFTYLGGTGDDEAQAIALDTQGNVLITGLTLSTDFKITNGLAASIGSYNSKNIAGDYDAFVSKLDPTLHSLLYSIYLGGEAQDYGFAIATDSKDNAYVTGQTKSFAFPIANAEQPVHSGVPGTLDAFVTGIKSDGSAILFSTYLGGTNDDIGWAIAVDTVDNSIYVAGQTASTNFPSIGSGTNITFIAGPVAFLTRFMPGGATIDYSTFLGGSGSDIAYALAVDGAQNVYVTGQTASGDLISNTNNATNLFFVNQAYPIFAYTNFAGSADAFVTKLSIPPHLTEQFSTTEGSTTLKLTWITSFNGYILQYSPTATPAASWIDDTTDAPLRTGNKYTVTINNPPTPRFYRLRRTLTGP